MNVSPSTLPVEVAERLTRMFCHLLTDDGEWVDVPLDHTRVIFASKEKQCKFDTWMDALRSGIAVYTDKKNGWRKCHTDSYWVYYADQLADEEDEENNVQPGIP